MKREGDNWRFRFCWASARRGFLWRKLKLFWSWAVESALTFSLPNSASYRFCTECTPKKLYVFYFTKDMCIRNIKCWMPPLKVVFWTKCSLSAKRRSKPKDWLSLWTEWCAIELTLPWMECFPVFGMYWYWSYSTFGPIVHTEAREVQS